MGKPCSKCKGVISPAFHEPFHGEEGVKIVVQVPVYQCGECGKECLRSVEETATLAFKATDHAYRSIDIHPT